MSSSTPTPLSPRVVAGQASEGSHSGPGRDTEVHDLPDGLTYRAIHDIFKPYGTVLRIRVVFDRNCSTRCYVTFSSSTEAKSASEAVCSLDLGSSDLKMELISSRNVAEGDDDYVPNVFEQAVDNSSSPITRIGPTPRWFVGYYRNGTGNYIRASRYLNKEIGHIPPENLKKYGKGVLIRAKDLTQAKMLLHFRCPEGGIFDAIKPHRSFNFCKGTIYNYDLFEFSEDEILSMCPELVQKVSKMNGRGNMIVLTFFGSSIMD